MKIWSKSQGLIAATFTPMNQNGSINLDMIGPYVDHLNAQGVTQAYGSLFIVVNGTAAEFASLSVPERKAVAEKWVEAGRNKMTKLIIHCGAGNLTETKDLAAHAQSVGADCVAAIAPTYFKPLNTEQLVEYCAEVAEACADTPFMYYHFPGATGITNIRTTEFFRSAERSIPNLIGAKFTSTDLFDAGEAIRVAGGKYDVIIGGDTILLSALAMGIDSAIGIAFSLIGRPCGRMFQAFRDGDLASARQEQYKVQDFWSSTHTPGNNHEMIRSFKAVMEILGLDFGPTRLPIHPMTTEEKDNLRRILAALNYYEWACK